MTITIPTPEKQKKIHLPEWLNQCLIGDQNNTDNNLICRAFEYAYKLHDGQYRKSGEAYIIHPIAVAELLRDLGGDAEMIAAGFLHDVVEDNEDVSPQHIEDLFGSNVRQLVEAVTKLSKFNFSNKTERQAENFRRMFLAMAQDIRVIVVKLADRLHNMRTLDFLPSEKQKAIARETKEIFAPLANRLGMWQFKWELEDLSFKYLHPKDYQNIRNLIAERRSDREARISQVISKVNEGLQQYNITPLEVKGRPKHLYGIYEKMQRQNKEFDQIFDIAALRIIVKTNQECYQALAVVHDAFRPIPGRFKDYIGLPKANLYQSLHTTVVSLNGRPLEVQIRTMEMHHIAEYGIAAHWKYKESGNSKNTSLSHDEQKFTWLRQLLDWQKDLKDAEEYVDNLKENLFDDDIYVFTPQGKLISLHQGSTAVDFAYRVHTEVGNHLKGVTINGRWSALDQVLKNGDIVEILTANNAHPSLDWLNFVKTPSARNRIRQWYKLSHREENIGRGRDLLEKELGKHGLESLLKSDTMAKVAQKCNFHKVDDMLVALGYGEITSTQVINRLREENKQQQPPENKPTTLEEESQLTNSHLKPLKEVDINKYPIAGIEGLQFRIARCCRPLPGENIIGVVTHLRGISIHHHDCPNLSNVKGDRFIPVRWNSQEKSSNNVAYPVDMIVEAIDRVGIFRDILGRLSDYHVNVSKAFTKTNKGKPALIHLTIEVKDSEQLGSVMQKIRNISDVLNIRRISDVN